MGEIAEMMLDGTMCEGCGEVMGGQNPYGSSPDYCSPQCARARGADWWLEMNGYAPLGGQKPRAPRAPRKQKGPRDTPCTVCGKHFRGQEGMENHRRMKHGEDW